MALHLKTSEKTGKAVRGVKRLIVEDEVLIAMEIEEAMQSLEAKVARRAVWVPEALTAARSSIDGALADIKLHGETSYQVIEELTAAGKSLTLMTGYSEEVIPDHLRQSPVPAKALQYGPS